MIRRIAPVLLVILAACSSGGSVSMTDPNGPAIPPTLPEAEAPKPVIAPDAPRFAILEIQDKSDRKGAKVTETVIAGLKAAFEHPTDPAFLLDVETTNRKLEECRQPNGKVNLADFAKAANVKYAIVVAVVQVGVRMEADGQVKRLIAEASVTMMVLRLQEGTVAFSSEGRGSAEKTGERMAYDPALPGQAVQAAVMQLAMDMFRTIAND